MQIANVHSVYAIWNIWATQCSCCCFDSSEKVQIIQTKLKKNWEENSYEWWALICILFKMGKVSWMPALGPWLGVTGVMLPRWWILWDLLELLFDSFLSCSTGRGYSTTVAHLYDTRKKPKLFCWFDQIEAFKLHVNVCSTEIVQNQVSQNQTITRRKYSWRLNHYSMFKVN